jgi:serine/threonine-protein kinase RsbW
MSEGTVIRLELPAEHRYLSVAAACVTELLARTDGIQDAEGLSYSVQLAVHEICANIVDHAYDGAGGRIAMVARLDRCARQMTIELHDTGRYFDPADDVEHDLDIPRESGYGLMIARQLLDDVRYERETSQNRWLLVKRFTLD